MGRSKKLWVQRNLKPTSEEILQVKTDLDEGYVESMAHGEDLIENG